MTESVEPRVLASAAARWWAALLNADIPVDNGDLLQSALANSTRCASLISDDKVEAFRETLELRVEVAIRRAQLGEGKVFVVLRVDYSPDEALTCALKEAEIPIDSTGPLPWKTDMYVYADRIEAKVGYGAPHVDVPIYCTGPDS